MFLKSIELSGFKSFANKTLITFDKPLTGIVGPNGCGKSNVTDAVRWVLGEQSAKSLRSGSSLSDIIFAGSQSRKPVNMAKCTLVFDNSTHIFDSPFEEIEITRQISRGSGEISNFINRTPCRLKDIQDLVMDTGLGRDSLSIISQGNISSFADAKPEERRLLFEEAAGVAKYKKRKKVSLSKLENVKNNLERVQDLIDTHKEQVDTLEEQARKAEEYNAAMEELSSIEISVLASRIQSMKTEENELQTRLAAMKEQQLLQSMESEKSESGLEEISSRLVELDGRISQVQRELAQVMEESMRLQKEKAVLDERRKSQLSSQDEQARRQSLIELFSEARYEYEDRRNRLSRAIVSLQGVEQNLDRKNRELDEISARRQSMQNEIHRMETQLAGIESRLAHPYYRNQGVQAVMKNTNRLKGIHGLVRDLLECEDEYLPAISMALSSVSEQIVVSDEKAAREAIVWLKRTQSGRATFLPLTVCKPRYLADWQQQIAKKTPGILGSADQFVFCRPEYDSLRSRLLGNILLAQDLESAGKAARALKQSVKIVTLGADVVHAGGAMSGGSGANKNVNPVPGLKKEKARIEQSIADLQNDLATIDQLIEEQKASRDKTADLLMGERIEKEKLANIVQVKKEKYESLQLQIGQMNLERDQAEAGNKNENSLISRLSALHEKQDTLQANQSRLAQEKSELASQQAMLQEKGRKARREASALSAAIQKDELDLARIETRLEQDLLRLGSEYSLTFEAALEKMKPVDMAQANIEVKALRRQIVQLGNVNLQAPEQLKEVREKYEFLSSQKQELEQAAKQILSAVDEMDATMVEQFETMFNRINDCLEEVFTAMFGGGKARLVLCDPNDLLNTGVDVDVQPPGKAVKNLSTFSGGEKALIAISVLFAILKARTVPLCIFDEAEAALDQANVERFARYLSNFKDSSQFITVTHRPGTMEQCDTLYGITMQQDGVSQVLKVQLKDAAQMSQ